MAIKNDLLGGTSWTNGEVLNAPDLNDTFDASVQNVCKDIVPTLTGTWDTNPTDLANMTDEDSDTVTGTGEFHTTGWVSGILIDLGVNMMRSTIGAKYTISTNTLGSFTIAISPDNSTYTDLADFTAGGSVSETVNKGTVTPPMKFRYIRLQLNGGGSANSRTLAVYEVTCK